MFWLDCTSSRFYWLCAYTKRAAAASANMNNRRLMRWSRTRWKSSNINAFRNLIWYLLLIPSAAPNWDVADIELQKWYLLWSSDKLDWKNDLIAEWKNIQAMYWNRKRNLLITKFKKLLIERSILEYVTGFWRHKSKFFSPFTLAITDTK